MTRRRIRSLLAALLASAVAAAEAPAATPSTAIPPDPAPLLLRLPDLGPGYALDRVDRSCRPLRSPSPGVRYIFGPGKYRGCSLSFQRVWTPPGRSQGPSAVHAFAVVFDTPAGPTSVLSRPRIPAAAFLGDRGLRIVEPAPSIGDQAVLMRLDRTILDLHVSAGIVLWRSGSTLGMVVAASLPAAGDADARAAVRLAGLQQARIANPTPLRPPVNDDRLVPLDDPTLGVPVMWLGERLPAHGRFATLNLRATSYWWFGPSEHPRVRLVYRTPHLPQTAKVDLWRPPDLRRDLRRPPARNRCRRHFDGDLDAAHATIVATYVTEHGRCPRDGGRYEAVAFFRSVGVTIHVSGRGPSMTEPYDSIAGLRTLLRALRPRTPSAASP